VKNDPSEIPSRIIDLEICINSDGEQTVFDAVEAAYIGDADRIELCSAMHLDGCTPKIADIISARSAFRNRPGLLVMIRPRGGDFCYSKDELQLMIEQIEIAANAGADGVVFGALNKSGELDINALERLTEKAESHNLQTTFHRAFDALNNPIAALPYLIDLNINRILTSGTPWGSSLSATDGIDQLQQILALFDNDIELVVGGGLNKESIPPILRALRQPNNSISLHTYSGVLENGKVFPQRVKELKDIIMTCC